MPRYLSPRTLMLVTVLVSPAALGQVPQLNQNATVDELVEDLSPNNTTLRQVERGNGLFNPNVQLYRRTMSDHFIDTGHAVRDAETGLYMPHKFIYRAPGVQARINQPDYLVMNQFNVLGRNTQPLFDGGFKFQRPLDLVYDLIPQAVTTLTRAPQAPWVDQRVDGRLRGHVPPSHNTAGETPYTTTIIQRELPRHSQGFFDRDEQVVDQPDAAQPARD